MNGKTARAYAERFYRVFDYIDRHLDDNLSVDTLSNLANFSRFHFQRQFSEFVGLSVTRYIQLMCLRRASYQLVFCEAQRIIDIALEGRFREFGILFPSIQKELWTDAFSIQEPACMATLERTNKIA